MGNNTSTKGGKGGKGNNGAADVAQPSNAPAPLDLNALLAAAVSNPDALNGIGADAIMAAVQAMTAKVNADKAAAAAKAKARIDAELADELAGLELALKTANDNMAAFVAKRNGLYNAAGVPSPEKAAIKASNGNGTGTKRGEGVRDALAAWLATNGPATLAECQAHIWATHATYAEPRSKEATDKPAYYKGLNTCEASVKWYLTTDAPKGLGLKADASGKFSVAAAPVTAS